MLSRTLFLDRGLGTEILAPALVGAGMEVVTMRAYYASETEAAGKADVDWIADVGREGWIALAKDGAIRKNRDERDAVRDARLRMFCLTNANITGAQFTERFLRHLSVILDRARQPGPYIDGVYADEVRRLFPPPG